MAVTEDLTLRMRATGARNAARDVDQTARSVQRAGKASERSSKQAGLLGRSTGLLLRPFNHLREEAFGLAKGVAAAGLAFGSVEGVKKSIETTDSLVKNTVKLRTQFGLTTQSASGLAAVLQARDLQPEGLQMGLVQLAKQLRDADHGSRQAQGGFRILGINARGVHKALNARDGLASTFSTVVDGLTKMPGGARKAALSQQLLGRASRGLAPLLQEGALGLKQQLKWANEYGVTLDGKTVGSVEDMAAAQTQAQYAMLGLQIQLGRFAAPLVTKANLTLAAIVKSFREGKPEGNQFARTVYQLGQDLKPVGHDLLVVGRYLKDHPKLLRDAALAYGAYRLKLLKLITILPAAYLKGLLAGRAFSRGYAQGATTGPALGRYAMIGRVAGGLIGTAAMIEIGRHFNGPAWAKILRGLLPFQPTPGAPRHATSYKPPAGAAPYHRDRGPLRFQPAVDPSGALPVTPTAAPTPTTAVIHVHTHLGDKEVAKSTHRVAIKRKATR